MLSANHCLEIYGFESYRSTDFCPSTRETFRNPNTAVDLLVLRQVTIGTRFVAPPTSKRTVFGAVGPPLWPSLVPIARMSDEKTKNSSEHSQQQMLPETPTNLDFWPLDLQIGPDIDPKGDSIKF